MIRTLSIQNLILVEKAEIEFGTGLTVITGETGAGKTALIQALRLIAGQRADASKVRKGTEKAKIQATLTIRDPLRKIINEAGIDCFEEEDLTITREILASGKSRAIICGQPAPLSLLQKIGSLAIDFVSQHEQIELKNSEWQRDVVDQFGEIDLTCFQESLREEKALQKERATLENSLQKMPRATLEEQQRELADFNLQPGEEKELFEEYSLLANAQEISATLSSAMNMTDEITEKTARVGKLLESLEKYTTDLKEALDGRKEAHLQLCELRASLLSFSSRVELDPGRLEFLEERLSRIDRLKKIYGSDLIAAKDSACEKLENFSRDEQKLASLQKKEGELSTQTDVLAKKITDARKEAAKKLALHLSKALRELHIPYAELDIVHKPQVRDRFGEDALSFYLRANQGEELALVKETSSGGELSRLLFSIKLLLADQKDEPTMIFDEIDANVGGRAAATMGLHLAELGKRKQVLCITHFPQVARYGDHHMRVQKKEGVGRTVCEIDSLSKEDREGEILRMLGGKKEGQRILHPTS